jgi:hypothetical protein
MSRPEVAVAFVAVLGSPMAAGAGILVTERTITGTTAQTGRVQIEGSRMRVESLGTEGPRQTTIFDGGRQVLWIVNDDQKTYREMTKADMDRVGGQMAGAMAQRQEQMKNMPPEQRAMMEKMMPQNANRVFIVGRGEDQGFSGVPVRQTFTAGQEQTTVDPIDVGRQNFPASTFEVPAGFQKETMGMGQRR